MDYQGNTDKDKVTPPEKQIEKVVTGEVIQKQKSIGRKFKDVFFGGDLKLAMRYVGAEVLLPAFRNLLVDSVTKGAERVVYGDSSYRRRPVDYRPRVQYNNPIYRGIPRDPRERAYLPDQPRDPYRVVRRDSKDIIVATRDDADVVVERLIDILDKYETASVADLNQLLGLPTSHIDNKWGWRYLNNVEVRQIREGYLIELPPVEEI